jgi:RimJ/RimL family protein N-acetyltransferase
MVVFLMKKLLLETLPIGEGPLTIRIWTREDLDFLATWPNYLFPYEGFEFSFKTMSAAKRDKLFQERSRRSDLFPLVVDHSNQLAIGYIALSKIDWVEGQIGNFGFRIHPELVNKGIGTSVLRMVCLWLFDCGISCIGVDVAASNTRAVRCYEKVGFYEVGEIWRDALDLRNVDVTDKRYDFLRQHLRLDGEVPKLRFFIMEITPIIIK